MENPFTTIDEKLKELNSKIDSILVQPQVEKPINLEGAAEFLGRSEAAVYTLCSRGTIPFYKKARKLYFLKSELLEWVRNGTQPTRQQRIDIANKIALKK